MMMGTLKLFSIFTSVEVPDALRLSNASGQMLPEPFHKIPKITLIEREPGIHKVVIKGKSNKAVLFREGGFMHTTYCPNAGAFKATFNALAARELKKFTFSGARRRRKGD